MRLNFKLFAFSVFILAFLTPIIIPKQTNASLVGFNPGNIMSDYVMSNKNTMTAVDIQNFLNTKVPTCTTNQIHTSIPNENRAIAPCLKDFAEHGLTAAQIIWSVSQNYSINPQVLIVLLEKEQGLVTDTWPRDGWWWTKTNLGSPVKECTDTNGNPKYCVNVQYRSATGYGCYDNNNPCDEQYYGFTNQVIKAASLFREVLNGGWSNYPVGSNYIQYNPSASCGGSNVNIQNRATSGLYRYTPYQPNDAALAAGWGTASCGAYGNRNFYNYFTEWFGPTNSALDGIVMTNIQQPNATPARGETVTYIYSLKNNLTTSVTLDAVGVVGRFGSLSGANKDFGWQGPITLQPGVTQQFTFTSRINDIGTIYAWPAVNYRGAYTHYNNWGITLNSHAPNFTLSQPLSINPSTIYAGQNVTFTAILKNNESKAVYYDAIGIPVKYYDRYSYDAVWVGPGTIAAGAEITLSGVRNIDKPGPYTYWVSTYFNNSYTTIGQIKNFDSQEVHPNFSVSGLTFNNTSPAQGENLSATFTVKNNLPVPITVDGVGVVGRYGSFNGLNRDLGWQGPITFAAGETKSFSGFTRAITDVGTHYYWIGVFDNGVFIQYNNWGSTIVSH